MSQGVGIVSLGCPRNLVDSESILSRLKQKHISITELEKAGTVLVNTCAFIKEAKEESIETILHLLELKQKGLIKKIIVYGCLVQRYKDELYRNLKGVDAFVGRLGLNGEAKRAYPLTPKHLAYVKISEGCGNLCSYCVIPNIKGRLSSRTKESIINQVRILDENNTKEINLVGQDITLYGRDCYGRSELVELIKDILGNTHNIRWIRLLYLNPAHISDALIDLIKREKRICKYIDLPIQHINDRILKLMNRNITRREIASLIKKIRQKIDGVFVRTSIITGFPSETEDEFQELLDFIKDTKFQRLGAFIYSKEENTPAYSFKGHLHYQTKKKRFDEIMLAQREVACNLNKTLLGKVRDVMVDSKDPEDEHLFLARLEQDAPEVDGIVYVRTKKRLSPGEIFRVKIIDTWEYDLMAELM